MATIRAAIQLKDRQSFRVGTEIRVESFFYDSNDNLVDPDSNNAYIQVLKPDGTSYLAATTMTRITVGSYYYDVQTLTTDGAGLYKFETRGATGSQTCYRRTTARLTT
jgi:hypothetical protein